MIQEVYIRNGLSKREAEVAEHVSRGLSNKEVGDKLFVTEKTIKFHLTNIYRKMNLASRTQLIVWSLPYMNFNDPNNRPTADINPAMAARHSATENVPQRHAFGPGAPSINGSQSNSATSAVPLNIPLGINPVQKVS
jgi:LuxR family transcriptional regulator, positive regulator of biofilm formation